MGIVYLATQRGLDRLVALKVMDPRLLDDQDFVARFTREATTLAKVDSPHIIAIYDHGRVGDVLYLATQYVAGGDLSRLIETRGALSAGEALSVFRQVLKGLHDAHRAGVIHRDIKPANILIRTDQTEPHAYLCDFGIAQSTEADQYTRTGVVAGSTAFMAPERSAGLPATVQSDLYSAACVLWVMLSGKNLYSGTDFQVASQHATGPIPQLNASDRPSQAINLVFRSCLAKDPGKRPRSADEVLRSLAGIIADSPEPEPDPAATRLRPAELPLPTPTVVEATVLRVSPPPPEAIGPSSSPLPLKAHDRSRNIGLVVGITSAAVVVVIAIALLAASLRGGGQRTDAAPAQATVSTPGVAGQSPSAGAATTEGAPAYTCWDGTSSAGLPDCGTPSGNVGLMYVFPSIADGRDTCELDSPLIKTRPGTTSYRCQYSDGFVLYRYWADGAEARKHFEAAYAGLAARTDLVLDGQVVGYVYRGKLRNGDYTTTAALLSSHFTVSAASPNSASTRDSLFAAVGFRAVESIKGYPNDGEPGQATSG